MKYYKIVENGYLIAIGTGESSGEEITKEEYDNIMTIVCNRPEVGENVGCRLKTDLTWELYERPIVEDTDPDISDSEALDIILGGDGA